MIPTRRPTPFATSRPLDGKTKSCRRLCQRAGWVLHCAFRIHPHSLAAHACLICMLLHVSIALPNFSAEQVIQRKERAGFILATEPQNGLLAVKRLADGAAGLHLAERLR